MTEENTNTEEQSVPPSDTGEKVGRILVVDDERSARTALAALLAEEGYQVEQVRDGYKALGMIESNSFDLILTDLRMPLMDGIELIKKAKDILPQCAFIVMTAYGSIEDAVTAMKIGAEDFLIKPLNFEAVSMVVDRTLKRRLIDKELSDLKDQKKKRKSGDIIGSSGPMRDVLQLAEQVADSPATVLICGEPGTGKQLLAKYIHSRSKRATHPFVTIHFAALPEELLEAELFGKVSHPGQDNETYHPGVLERAGKGTVFLDEIGNLSPNLQIKLTQFLQSREFLPVGATETQKSDARIIASSKQHLEAAVREDNFREDLYYRINVVRIDTPPLSTRHGDIPQLVRRFVQQYAEENKKTISSISPEFLEILEKHDWPGNVQELENIVERAVVLCDEEQLDVKHLPKNLGELVNRTHILGRGVVIPGSKLSDIERFAIIRTYEATGGKTAETAGILDVSQRKIQYKLREYMVDMDKY